MRRLPGTPLTRVTFASTMLQRLVEPAAQRATQHGHVTTDDSAQDWHASGGIMTNATERLTALSLLDTDSEESPDLSQGSTSTVIACENV